MQLLERCVEDADEAIAGLTDSERYHAEQALQRLDSEQIRFVRETLTTARIEGRLPIHQVSLLEYFLQEWWEHNPATKLAVIAQVVGLSDEGDWPAGSPGDRIVVRAIASLAPVAARA